MEAKAYKGRLVFFSETGTEGGYWAFQDVNFISLASPVFGVSNDEVVFDVTDNSIRGLTSNAEVYLNENWLPFPDPIINDPDYLISSLYRGEEQGDLSADKCLMERYQFQIKYAKERLDDEYGVKNWRIEGSLSNVILKDGTRLHYGCTPSTIPKRPYGIPQNGLTRVTVKWENGQVENGRKSDTLLVERFDYKGLHVLKNGDELKTGHPTENRTVWQGSVDLEQFPAFKEHANGAWIHADQRGISREEWSRYFFDGFPAELKINIEESE